MFNGQGGVNGIPRTDRVHVQDYGWEKSYATNGAMSGTSGESKRLEGIPKGEPAPSATYEGIAAVTEKAFIEGFKMRLVFRRFWVVTLSLLIVFTVLPVSQATINAEQYITLSGVAHIQDFGDVSGTWDESAGILNLAYGHQYLLAPIHIHGRLGDDTVLGMRHKNRR